MSNEREVYDFYVYNMTEDTFLHFSFVHIQIQHIDRIFIFV